LLDSTNVEQLTMSDRQLRRASKLLYFVVYLTRPYVHEVTGLNLTAVMVYQRQHSVTSLQGWLMSISKS